MSNPGLVIPLQGVLSFFIHHFFSSGQKIILSKIRKSLCLGEILGELCLLIVSKGRS